MPNPNSSGQMDFHDAPGADMSFDDLFPSEADTAVVQPAAPETPPAEKPQAPAPDFFIKAGRTVYKTQADAEEGISHKDTLIDKYRSFLATQGVDPDTLQTVPPKPTEPPSPYTYLGNDKKLYTDLAAAADRRDPEAYARTLRQYNSEVLASEFAPIAPLISEVARQRAIRQVSSEVPEFTNFVASEDYRQTLETLPRLKEAISHAENDFRGADSLGELYKIAYLASQGRRKPEPVVAVPNPTPTRPTTSPSTMTPPTPTTPPNMRTSEGRKTLIRDLEARGVLDRTF